MRQHAVLVVAPPLSMLLLTRHVTDDIVPGISQAEPSNAALIVFVGTLWALGRLGVTFILPARGLWSLQRGQPR